MSGTGLLDRYGRDLADAVRPGPPAAATNRDREIERAIQVLSRDPPRKCNPMLIGAPGAARTAVVAGLARAILAGAVPSALAGRRVYALDLGALSAGSGYHGAERVTQLLQEVRDRGDVIPFVDRLHLFTGAGAPGHPFIDITTSLVPVLARGQLRMISAMTLEEYRAHIEVDAALQIRFAPIRIGDS